jgi:hypothetical protein
MRKFGPAILLSIWALVALPALCTGGFVAHACDCASEALCEHEVGCEDDPCSNLSAITGQRSDGSDMLPLPMTEELSWPATTELLGSLEQTGVLLYRYGERPCLPFAPSDIPRLI